MLSFLLRIECAKLSNLQSLRLFLDNCLKFINGVTTLLSLLLLAWIVFKGECPGSLVCVCREDIEDAGKIYDCKFEDYDIDKGS